MTCNPSLLNLAIGGVLLLGCMAALLWFAYRSGEHRGYMRGMTHISGAIRERLSVAREGLLKERE